MALQIQIRQDLASRWTATNPTLAAAEPGLETDTGQLKFGDGASSWSELPYFPAPAATIDGGSL